jgi:hypothetical protein
MQLHLSERAAQPELDLGNAIEPHSPTTSRTFSNEERIARELEGPGAMRL